MVSLIKISIRILSCKCTRIRDELPVDATEQSDNSQDDTDNRDDQNTVGQVITAEIIGHCPNYAC